MWYLEDMKTERKVSEYSTFDAGRIKEDIKNYLSNPWDEREELWLYRVGSDKGTV